MCDVCVSFVFLSISRILWKLICICISSLFGITDNSPQSFSILIVNAEQLSPEGRAENLSSHGPDLVSPTVTSCIEISKDRREQQKKNEDLSNRAGSVGEDRCCISADTARSACGAEPVDNNSKEGTALEDNRNPSFEVSTAICSDKTHNVSRPPTVKPQKRSQVLFFVIQMFL